MPQLNLQFGETTWEIIERLCRFAKFLAYDDADGNVVLRSVSEEKHSSGVREGVNLLAASVAYTMDGRFSEYHVYPMTVLPLMQAEQSAGGSLLPPAFGKAKDEGVKRLRRRIIILEHSGQGPIIDACQARAEWEQGRRAGRSETATVLVDSWRDSAGKLWEPNRLVNIHIPSCQVKDQTWIIGEVTYLRGEGGTTARISAMPARAFDPQYEPIVAYNWQLDEAARQNEKLNFNPKAGDASGV